MKKPFSEAVFNGTPLKLDGCHGAVLMAGGVDPNRTSLAAIEHEQLMYSIHLNYLKSGSNMLVTNTFSLSSQQDIPQSDFDGIIAASVSVAANAAKDYPDAYIGLDIGPCVSPLKTEEQKKAVFERFAAQIISGERCGGFDYIIFETFASIAELKLAVEAAKEFSEKPILTSMTFGENEHTWYGDTLTAYSEYVNSEDIVMCGLNCTLTPEKMLPVAEKLLTLTDKPVFAQPNRGDPININGKTGYAMSAQDYANGTMKLKAAGLRVIGGCCGADNECMKLIK